MSETPETAEADRYGLTLGRPDLRSVGALTFGPGGVLFVADNASAAILAIDVGPVVSADSSEPFTVTSVDARLAAHLGCPPDDVWIRDLAVRPGSGDVFLSVMRGSGDAAIPLLMRVGADGSLSAVDVDRVRFARKQVDDAPAEDDARLDGRTVRGLREGAPYENRGVTLQIARDPLRTVTVTDLAYVDGTLIVAGASNEEFTSSLRKIPFPFNGDGSTTSLEIFHVNHGKYESASPIRTFIPYAEGTAVIATYTCTPIVHFALDDLTPGSRVHGRTVADLGSMNTPLDMVSFRRDNEEYVLVCNTRHPMIKVASADIDAQPALTEPKGPSGVSRETLPLEGVLKMDALGADQVLMLQENQRGGVDLRSYATASL